LPDYVPFDVTLVVTKEPVPWNCITLSGTPEFGLVAGTLTVKLRTE
jgi:hypothetical protein